MREVVYALCFTGSVKFHPMELCSEWFVHCLWQLDRGGQAVGNHHYTVFYIILQ